MFRSISVMLFALMWVFAAANGLLLSQENAGASPAKTEPQTDDEQSKSERTFVRIDQPTVYKNLVGDGKTVLMVAKGGSVTFDCIRGSTFRDIEIRSKTDQPQELLVKGTNARIDNLVLDGLALHLDGLQNSTLTSLCVVRSRTHGIIIDNAASNCEIDGTIKLNLGYGIFINSDDTRSIEIYGKPVEENKLGQICINAMSRYGSISIKGRLNSIEGNGSPLTVNSQFGKVILQSFLDFRNMNREHEDVQIQKQSRAKVIHAN